jgi:hypothetical protein
VISTSTSIGVATLFAAVTIIALTIRTYLNNGRNWKVFLPGLGGALVGATLALCAGGAFGWLASAVAGAGNTASGLIPWATGTDDECVASTTVEGLRITGGGIAVAIVALGFVVIRASSGDRRRRLLAGVFVGVCVTYTAGVGGLVDEHLIPLFNDSGDQIVQIVENGADQA